MRRYLSWAAIAVVVAWPLSAQQQPAITGAAVSGTTVIVSGVNLHGSTGLSVGGQVTSGVAANAEGTLVTGTLPVALNPGSSPLELTAAATSTAACIGNAPGVNWVCADGAWVPPDHPIAIEFRNRSSAARFVVTVGGVGAVGATGATGPTGPTGPTGAAGATGALGAAGASGVPGSVGATGPTGSTGPPGVLGAMGGAGATGAPGAIGATGPPGSDAEFVFTSAGSFGSDASEATIAPGERIPLTTQSSATTLDFIFLEGAVTIGNPGRYLITWAVATDATSGSAAIRLGLGGVSLGTTIGQPGSVVSGHRIADVGVGQTLQLENASVGSPLVLGGSGGPTVRLTLVRLQ